VPALFSDFFSRSVGALEDRVVSGKGAWQGQGQERDANKAQTSAPPAISVIYQSQRQFMWLRARSRRSWWGYFGMSKNKKSSIESL